jgi:septum formation protein
MTEAKNKTVILASTSPRRKMLLAEAGFKFRVIAPEVDESAFSSEGTSPRQFAERLALAKAESVAKDLNAGLVIGADTIAELDGEIIGKPADAAHAERIARKLFSAPHRVITAVAIIDAAGGKRIVQSDVTIVYPKKMSDEQLADHIKGGTWQGKAGAYAIQETGDEFVERIDGSLTNVMGLPMELLADMLVRLS